MSWGAYGRCRDDGGRSPLQPAQPARGAGVAFALALVVAVGAATVALAKPTVSPAAATAVSCSKVKIAFMSPLTGPAAFLGTDQLSWATYALKTLPSQGYPKVRMLVGDTQLDHALALSLARKYVSDPTIMALIGPSTFGSVDAAGPTFTAAKLPAISPFATKTSLTKGPDRIQGFWRVVPDDSVQGPSDARFMISKGAKKVVIIDDQEIYSTGLADAATATLKAKGVEVIRLSVSQSETDFSSFVTKVPDDANFVFLPWQQPPSAQTFAQQMANQGKTAAIFGSDETSVPTQFKAPGAFVSVFTPDITAIPADKALIAGWQKANAGKAVGSFGPPAYGAVQIALAAIQKACKDKAGTISRRDVYARVSGVKVKNWILGGSFAFSTKSHDPKNGRFYVFQIQGDGKYRFVS